MNTDTAHLRWIGDLWEWGIFFSNEAPRVSRSSWQIQPRVSPRVPEVKHAIHKMASDGKCQYTGVWRNDLCRAFALSNRNWKRDQTFTESFTHSMVNHLLLLFIHSLIPSNEQSIFQADEICWVAQQQRGDAAAVHRLPVSTTVALLHACYSTRSWP